MLGQLRSKALGHVLETLVRDAAERVVGELLRGTSVPVDERLFAVDTEVLDDLTQTVARLRSSPSLVDALPPLVGAFGALARLGDGTLADPLRELTAAAATAAVAGHVMLDLLGRPAHPLATAVVARVRDRLTPPQLPEVDGPAPVVFDATMTRMVEYLVSISGLLGDDATGAMATVADILGRTPETLIRWLWELGQTGTDPAADRAAAAAVSQALVGGLERVVTPWVEDLPQGELRELTMFVRPLLEITELALPLAVAPDLTSQGAARLRDQLDTQLTQLVGAATVRSLDRVVRPYFARGADQLRELADRVDRQDPAFGEFFAIANDVSALFRVDEIVVATGTPRPRTAGSLPEAVLADKAYSHPSVRAALRQRGIRFTSPERADQIARARRRAVPAAARRTLIKRNTSGATWSSAASTGSSSSVTSPPAGRAAGAGSA